MDTYKRDPWFIGAKDDEMNVAMKRLVDKKVPLPTFARQDMQRLAKIFQLEEEVKVRAEDEKAKQKLQERIQMKSSRNKK